MKYDIRIGQKTASVEDAPAGEDGRADFVVDGEEEPVGLHVVAPHHLRLRRGGRTGSCFVVRSDRGTWVWSEGRARLVEDAAERRAVRSAGGGVGQDVTPPMPAVVVRILVEEGDTVAKGAGLVVVTAMKMETTLVAPHDGTVTAIHTAVEAKVNPGDILVEIAPAAAADED